jgi:hypothetical protein
VFACRTERVSNESAVGCLVSSWSVAVDEGESTSLIFPEVYRDNGSQLFSLFCK